VRPEEANEGGKSSRVSFRESSWAPTSQGARGRENRGDWRPSVTSSRGPEPGCQGRASGQTDCTTAARAAQRNWESERAPWSTSRSSKQARPGSPASSQGGTDAALPGTRGSQGTWAVRAGSPPGSRTWSLDSAWKKSTEMENLTQRPGRASANPIRAWRSWGWTVHSSARRGCLWLRERKLWQSGRLGLTIRTGSD